MCVHTNRRNESLGHSLAFVIGRTRPESTPDEQKETAYRRVVVLCADVVRIHFPQWMHLGRTFYSSHKLPLCTRRMMNLVHIMYCVLYVRECSKTRTELKAPGGENRQFGVIFPGMIVALNGSVLLLFTFQPKSFVPSFS